jgi:hypothetical protein
MGEPFLSSLAGGEAALNFIHNDETTTWPWIASFGTRGKSPASEMDPVADEDGRRNLSKPAISPRAGSAKTGEPGVRA